MNIAAIRAASLVAENLSSLTGGLDGQTRQAFGQTINPDNIQHGITGIDLPLTASNTYTP